MFSKEYVAVFGIFLYLFFTQKDPVWLVFGVMIFLIFKNYHPEDFKDLDRKKYVSCCDKYGCNHIYCQRELHSSKDPLILFGILTAKNMKSYRLYRQKQNYFIQPEDDEYRTTYIRMTDDIYDGAKVKINNIDYDVYIYSDDFVRSYNIDYNTGFSTLPEFAIFHPDYSNRLYESELRIVGKLGHLDIYEKDMDTKSRFRYYVKDGSNIHELREKDGSIIERKLVQGDNVIFLGELYTVNITEN